MLTSTTFSARLQQSLTGTRVDLAGYLDLAVCDQLAATLRSLLTGVPAAVEVNLDRLQLLDAAGITTLIRAQRLARDHGGDLFVTNPHGIVRKVMVITEVLAVLTHQPEPGVNNSARPPSRRVAEARSAV